MAMPKTAIYENNGLVTGEYHIWFAGQFSIMKAISETLRMQPPSYQEFGFGVPAPDSRHDLTAF